MLVAVVGKDMTKCAGDEYEARVAVFIRAKGVTRCPTACALPTEE